MSIWDVRACRSCLTVKGKLEKIGDASKRQYSAITGHQISENDGYPTYFCMECRHHIRKSLAFRRKSRRAHFVLKEIMAVRKQISYSDIVTVNRKRTNLESSLNFWVPNNNACYLIANREGEEPQEELQKYDLQTPKYSRSYSSHLIDIEPKFEPPPTIEGAPENVKQENDDNNDNNDDIPTNDYLEPDPNIDMNDIFKDFPDDNENPSEDEEEPPVKIPVQKETDLDLGLRTSRNSIRVTAKGLSKFNMKALTLEEQKDRFERRKKWHPFVSAPFKCSMCLSTYKTMTELLEHVRYHNMRQFDHECQLCKNKFRTVEDLNIHVASCHMYEYACRICQLKFYTQMDAVKHARHNHHTYVHGQSTRELKGKSKTALKDFTLSPLTQQMMHDVMALRSRHKKKSEDVAPADKRFNCDICKTWLKSRHGIVIHMVTQHRYMYTCKKCKEVFTVRDHAIAHGDTHKKKKRFECTPCDLAFDGKTQLSRHRMEKHVERVPCNVCGVAATSERTLHVHQLKHHKYISLNDPLVGDPNHKCVQCGVQFMDKRALDTHLVNMNHTGADDVQFKCIPCKKVYDNEEQLDTHHITCVYASKYPRKCCYCSEMLSSALEYRAHYVQKHPSLPYRYLNQNSICDVCGKSVFKPQLEAHLKSHMTDAHQCRLCEAAHATPAAHLAHVLSAHARQPYHCALCARRFRYRADCKDHILKIHAPTMLYKCEFCSQEFSYFRNLKQHSESLHNLIIPPIKSKFQFKSKTKIFVYAHMKIHINELERPVVEQTEVELVDYLEQKSKPVDYKDYFVFNPDEETQESIVKPKQKKRKGVKIKNELETAVANITIQWPEPSVIYETEMLSDVKSEMNTVNESEVKSKAKRVKKEVKKEVKVEVVQSDMEVDMEMPLEVMENEEGHQYVMINGEMYRIACEDEIE